MQVDNNEEGREQDIVAAHFKCPTREARYLCVLDPDWKLTTKGDYDIGGTYSDGPDFWFLYRTHSYLQNTLMSLFVTNRRAGSFTISLGSTKTIPQHGDGDSMDMGKFLIEFDEMPECFDFYNLPRDTFSFVKTFCFTKSEVDALVNRDLLIAMKIENDLLNLSPEVISSVKLNHNFGKLLEEPDRSDLILESSDDRKFPVHKAIVIANSSVFRTLLEDPSNSYLKLSESSADIECLLQFMYTGTIPNLNELDCFHLMEMGTKYNIRGLAQLSQHSLLRQIRVDNAVDVFLLAHNHKLSVLQKEVIMFIRDHPAVFRTKTWVNLKDVEIAKELFQCITTEK